MFVTEQTDGIDLYILREPQLPDFWNCSREDMAISYFMQFWTTNPGYDTDIQKDHLVLIIQSIGFFELLISPNREEDF